MSVQWEVEYPGLDLHPPDVTWTMKNIGDETAHAGSHCGEITIWRHPESEGAHFDATPWTNPLTLARDVEAGTLDTMTHPLGWEGQPHGLYTAKVTLGDRVEAELYFQVTFDGIQHPYQ